MQIMTIPFRDFQRGTAAKDVVAKLIDKKTGKSKGLFIPPAFEEEVLGLLETQQEKSRQKKLHALNELCGIATGLLGDVNTKTLRMERLKEKYDV
jgi:hypothetical protein